MKNKKRGDSWKAMKVSEKLFSHKKKKTTRYQNKTKHQASQINLLKKKKGKKMIGYPHKSQNMGVEIHHLHTNSICARECKGNNEIG